jgi:hypothetical protein
MMEKVTQIYPREETDLVDLIEGVLGIEIMIEMGVVSEEQILAWLGVVAMVVGNPSRDQERPLRGGGDDTGKGVVYNRGVMDHRNQGGAGN